MWSNLWRWLAELRLFGLGNPQVPAEPVKQPAPGITIALVCDAVKHYLTSEASKPGGPDVDGNVLTLMGKVSADDPLLKLLLDTKDSITIVIKQTPEVVEPSSELADNMARIRRMAGAELPAEQVGQVG